MNKWNMNDVAAQENQPLTSDDEMDLGTPLPRRERGQTFSDNNQDERQILMQKLARLAGALDPEKKQPTQQLAEAEQDGSPARSSSDGIDSVREKISAAESSAMKTPTRGINRGSQARAPTTGDSGHRKSSPGGSDMPGTSAHPSNTPDRIDSIHGKNSEADPLRFKTPTRGINSRSQVRIPATRDSRYPLLGERFDFGECPQESPRGHGWVQRDSQHKSSPGGSDMSTTLACPSKPSKPGL